MSEPIRVLRILNRFNLGGPTYNAAYLTRHLGNGFETVLVGGRHAPSEASSEHILDANGIRATILPRMGRSIAPISDFLTLVTLIRMMRKHKPHIVHTHASKAGLLGRLAAWLCRVPVVVHTFHGHVFHSYFGWLQTEFYKFLERCLAKVTTCIVAISHEQKHELAEIHRIATPAKFRVIPLGFDLARFTDRQEEKRIDFRSRYGLQNSHLAIGIIGRLVPVKNHRMFLQAVAQLAPEHPQARFFIIGDGESRDELLNTSDQLGIECVCNAAPTTEKPLCFTSWIRDADVVCAGLDVVCLTSLNEGTPVSLIEAQAAAKPVVSTRVGGIADIVMDGHSALLCNVNDTAAFTAHLAALITNPELRRNFGSKGRDFVMNRFGYQRLAADHRTLYTELLNHKQK